MAPDRIPLLRGLATAGPTRDDLKALCAAFGTSSAAPMLHVEGSPPRRAASPRMRIARGSGRTTSLRAGGSSTRARSDRPRGDRQPARLDRECRALAAALAGRPTRVPTIVTAGRQVIAEASTEGTLATLEASGVRVLPDLCWCSICEPVFPTEARTLMTNSGKYAHYGSRPVGAGGPLWQPRRLRQRRSRRDGAATASRMARTRPSAEDGAVLNRDRPNRCLNQPTQGRRE